MGFCSQFKLFWKKTCLEKSFILTKLPKKLCFNEALNELMKNLIPTCHQNHSKQHQYWMQSDHFTRKILMSSVNLGAHVINRWSTLTLFYACLNEAILFHNVHKRPPHRQIIHWKLKRWSNVGSERPPWRLTRHAEMLAWFHMRPRPTNPNLFVH